MNAIKKCIEIVAGSFDPDLIIIATEAAADLARITAENEAYKKVCDGKTSEEMGKYLDFIEKSLERTVEKAEQLIRAIQALKE